MRRFDATTGTPIGADQCRPAGFGQSVAMGPVDGQTVIVSGGEDGTVRRFDATTGTPIGDPIAAQQGSVESVAMGPVDGQTVIVSGGEDGTVRRFDATTGTPIGDPIAAQQGSVESVAMGPVDGQTVIVSGGNDGTVRVWQAAPASTERPSPEDGPTLKSDWQLRDVVKLGADEPAKADRLGRLKIAVVLAEQLRLLVNDETEPLDVLPILIDAPWGAGKSSLMNFLRNTLDPRKALSSCVS